MRFLQVAVAAAGFLGATGCTSRLGPLANGYNDLRDATQGERSTADTLPTSGDARYEGYLLMSVYDGDRSIADFLGRTTLEGTFTTDGGRLSGSADGFVDNATDRAVNGQIDLTNGVLARTETHPGPRIGGTAFVVNADGTLTTDGGDSYAFDSVISGSVVGASAGYLSAMVDGDVATGDGVVSAGGTLLAERHD